MRLTKDGHKGLAEAESIFNFDDLRGQTRSFALYIAPPALRPLVPSQLLQEIEPLSTSSAW
jgi:hypothetical protein